MGILRGGWVSGRNTKSLIIWGFFWRMDSYFICCWALALYGQTSRQAMSRMWVERCMDVWMDGWMLLPGDGVRSSRLSGELCACSPRIDPPSVLRPPSVVGGTHKLPLLLLEDREYRPGWCAGRCIRGRQGRTPRLPQGGLDRYPKILTLTFIKLLPGGV